MYKICCDDKYWHVSDKRIWAYENTKFWNIFYGPAEDLEFVERHYNTFTYYVDLNPKIMDKIISVVREESPVLNVNEAKMVDYYLGTNFSVSKVPEIIPPTQPPMPELNFNKIGISDMLDDLGKDLESHLQDANDIYKDTFGILKINDTDSDSSFVKHLVTHTSSKPKKNSFPLNTERDDIENTDMPQLMETVDTQSINISQCVVQNDDEETIIDYDMINKFSTDANIIKQIMEEHKRSAELSSDSSDMCDNLDMLD